MNCKQGDLAIIMQSSMGHEGKIVLCKRYVGLVWWVDEPRPVETWEIDKPFANSFVCGPLCEFPDKYLRPIKPDQDEDSITESKELETCK